jgi:uncharacterized protein YjbI with pentapeptide repeats
MTIQYNIKNRFTGDVQFTAEIDCKDDEPAFVKAGLAVRLAIKHKANLYGADLSEANLYGADLSDAILSGAILYGAILSGANLSGANLSGADLSKANLSEANLSEANLYCAILYGADLSGADLSGADLSGADLYGADLSDADLSDADLSYANLSYANLIDGGQRSDGYRFVGWIKDGELIIRAGCRNFTLPEARIHWGKSYNNEILGSESQLILDRIEATARLRGMISDRDKERGSD